MIMRVKARMDAGEAVPDCLVKTLLLTQEKEKLDWEDLCMLSAVFTLGVHSTSGVIQWFLALISSYPDVQAKAHTELDTVIGRGYWLSAEDEQHLPYIRAINKECTGIVILQKLFQPYTTVGHFINSVSASSHLSSNSPLQRRISILVESLSFRTLSAILYSR